jgi:hypothetical protein
LGTELQRLEENEEGRKEKRERIIWSEEPSGSRNRV